MLSALLAGVAAGLGIAVPVGAIGVLILDLGARRGFLPAFAAGSGAATADLLYASLAAFAGGSIAQALEPAREPIRFVSATVLVAIAVTGLRRAAAARAVDASNPPRTPAGAGAVYAGFLGLTLLNPMTVTYFTALVLGGAVAGGQALDTPATRAAFVLGAWLASWGWQSLLAASGSLLHQRVTPRGRLLTAVLGNAVVLALAARIALS